MASRSEAGTSAREFLRPAKGVVRGPVAKVPNRAEELLYIRDEVRREVMPQQDGLQD